MPHAKPLTLLAASALIAIELLAAQSFGQWVRFTNQTQSRIIADPAVGTACIEEKDFIWGDVDNDGDIDLICVRKQPWDLTGRRTNVLFMNEGVKEGHATNGVLVDRTAQYAVDSDIEGDQGFLTPTNDRDVKLLDVNNDGWLDIITVATLSDGTSKHISHPRIYINLGNDKEGNWQGFRYESARIPQLAGNAPSGFPHAPRFNNVAIGDINNDGLPDLYFADGDFGISPQTFDFNNRLLLNVAGYFVDVTATAIPAVAQVNGNAVTTQIVDLNLDGAPDLIRHAVTNPGQGLFVLYNNPDDLGTFGVPVLLYTGAPTDCSIGDLNNDGLPDIVISDDGTDRYRLHSGIDGNGLATFGSFIFTSQLSADDGFAGESVIADLDADGFNDVIVTDVDFNIPGCNRRAHIYRNLGNVPNVSLQEQSPPVLPASMLTGTHDVAVFDLNGDGFNDVILGRCTGITIWINHLSCPADIAGSGDGTFDGTVDANDLLAVINNWGPCENCAADVTNDGVVNANDLLAVINAWGACP